MAETGAIKDGLFYSKEHEWVRLENNVATIGISDHAQHELGDIVYIEMPEVGEELASMGELGVVESVKAASDIYAPMAGKVAEINGSLEAHPEQVNSDPYGKGWIVKLAAKDPGQVKGLMDAAAYKAYLESL